MSRLKQEIVELIPQLRRFATALTRDRTAADDLVQDALLRAISRLEQFREGTNLRAWLFTIMRNLYISELRRYKSKPALRVIEGELGSSPASQEDSLQIRDLEAALGTLPEEQRTTLLLVALEGLSYEEAAAVTDVAIGTVRSRVSRAREALRQQLVASTGVIQAGPTEDKAAVGGDIVAGK